MGNYYKHRKARFNSYFCKRINHIYSSVEMVTAFEERDELSVRATKFIYDYNKNNKQGFTPNGINNECVSNSS